MACIGYSPKGERLVAGIVPLSEDKKHVLVITAQRRKGWVLPKGGWETDEATQSDAAKREAWEEAGLIVQIVRDLGDIGEMRDPKDFTLEVPKQSYRFFEAVVEKMESTYPEMGKRNREWMTFAQAHAALKGRPELQEALSRSSIVRS